uniref:Adenine phosphoribosyltransferase n=1 Tax=Timema monikensis TaxID=170555 RepID=A0A7R9EHC9_9NEOP|nr:unnamed protein product [Timema monikensis]
MEEFKEDIELVKSNISSYPDFPKPGILFRDIFSIFNNPKAAKALDSVLLRYVRKIVPQTDVVVALESRGFLFGPTLALELGVPFVPVRKKGKLPGTVYQQSYALEYGTDILEIQASSIQLGQKVLIVDDLIATGGSGRKIGTFLHPLAAMTFPLALPHVKVVISSVMWGSPFGRLTRPHVVVPTWINLGLRSECSVRVVPKYGIATSFVAADNLLSAGTVLPYPAGNSLPGPSQDHINYKRRKRVDNDETLKRASTFILERVINGTLEASCQLVRQCGGEVLQCLVVMELRDLKGKEKVSAQVESFIKF